MINTDFFAFRFELKRENVKRTEESIKDWIIENRLFAAENVYGSFFSSIYRGNLRIHVVFSEDTDAFKEEILALFLNTFEKTHMYSGKVWIGNENKKIIQYLQEAFDIEMDCEQFLYVSHKMEIKREDFHKSCADSQLEAKAYEDEHLKEYLELLEQSMTFKIPPFPYLQKENELREEFSSNKEAFQAFWISDKLVGLYLLSGNEVDHLAVAPEFQNLGYGDIILAKAIESIFKNDGTDTAWLLVVEWNSKAFAFYRKFGLVDTDVYHVPFNNA